MKRLGRFYSLARVVAVSLMTGLSGLFIGTSLLPTANATPPLGINSIPVASGVLPGPLPVALGGHGAGTVRKVEVNRIAMTKFVLEPGGTFGWHQHGGPVWAVVASGTLTLYSGDDRTCEPQVVEAGSALLDPGDHTHVGRNEGEEVLEIYATFMLPEGGEPRIDAPDPGHCSF